VARLRLILDDRSGGPLTHSSAGASNPTGHRFRPSPEP